MIAAVVPSCNRRSNLELLFASLAIQTTRDFTVIVADDGSSDGTREYVENLARTGTWSRRLRWIGCGPDLGVRTGRARNIGAANVPAGTQLLVMLDTDLVLPPDTMSLFARRHEMNPRAVLFGRVDWLPPLEHATVLRAVHGRELPALRKLVPESDPVRLRGTFTGPELRAELFASSATGPIPLRPEWALPLNSGWPPDQYWAAGGFDESMTGYGYQDMHMGAHAAKAGATCVAHPEIWALHVWHPKPPSAMIENQRNLDRYLRAHDDYLRRTTSDAILEADVDWSLWWHYHAERGGIVARCQDRLWAISNDRRHRLALPDTRWLADLGQTADQVVELPEADLTAMTEHGTATHPV